MPTTAPPDLILASSSRYRQALLARLGLPFRSIAPAVDEDAVAGETADASDRAQLLARAKAMAVAPRAPKSLIIGCDQVAASASAILHKPGDRARNIAQLAAVSGQQVRFYSALCVLNAATGEALEEVARFSVWLRPLSRAQIEAYVDREPAFDCAGGFKAESLGIALCRRMEGSDPTTLIGLPLIRLTDLLARCGVDVLRQHG